MSFDYAPLEQSADALIQSFGVELTFTRTTEGAFNPALGTTANTTSTFAKYACVFNYNESEINGESIMQSDRRLLAQGHTYEIGDTVSLDNEPYRVVAVRPTKPADITMAVNLQVRK
jgi:hypothetical protein